MSDSSSPESAGTPPEPGTLAAAVPTNPRHDGWTPEKQHDFIAALAESGCIAEASRAVGMTPRSAYRLRARPDASHFRQAWDIALDFAIRRLGEAAFSRALNGVATLVFYQGEQVGERRRYDERLTMFLLRYRDPMRFGAWLDDYEARRHPDGAAIVLAHALNAVMDSAHGFEEEPEDEADRADPDSGLMARALAEGPALPASVIDSAGIPDDYTPAMREWMAGFNATYRKSIEGEDHTKFDARQTLTVRRRRKPGKGQRSR